MKQNQFNSFQWKRSWIVGTLISFITVWFLFFDTHSLLTKIQLENQKKELIERTKQYEQQTAELEEKIENLQKNPELLERIVREDYGMKKPNETVYRIERTN
ncbi:MAG: septum formation initiator family protein [Balneolaceae bacterium]|nr:septum formation initiator family protein [Balneolaceae bacterium]